MSRTNENPLSIVCEISLEIVRTSPLILKQSGDILNVLRNCISESSLILITNCLQLCLILSKVVTLSVQTVSKLFLLIELRSKAVLTITEENEFKSVETKSRVEVAVVLINELGT